jgi:hypothetical protein
MTSVPTPSMMSSGQPGGTQIAPSRSCSSHLAGAVRVVSTPRPRFGFIRSKLQRHSDQSAPC